MDLLRSILKELLGKLLPRPDGWTFFGVLLSLAVFGVAWNNGEAHPMSEVTKWALPFLMALSAWVAFAVIGSIVLAITAHEKERKSLKSQVAILKAKPEIEFLIKEAFIVPRPGMADCFVRLFIHNKTDVPCKNVHDFAMRLKIGNKEYSRFNFLNLDNYMLAHYRWETVWDDDEQIEEVQKLVYSNPLSPN